MKKYIISLLTILTTTLAIGPIFAAETERRDSTANFPWAQQRSYYQTTAKQAHRHDACHQRSGKSR